MDNNPPSSVSTWEFGLFRHKQAVSGAPAVGACLGRDVRKLRGMKITFLPHALEQMSKRGISEDEARAALEEADEEGAANLGRLYVQKRFGRRRIRVIYNQGADEAVVVSVMLRRREGGA